MSNIHSVENKNVQKHWSCSTGPVGMLPHVAAGNIPQLGSDLFTMFKEDIAFAYLLPSAGPY